MSRNQNKTLENDSNVNDFLEGVQDAQKKADSYTILQMMEDITGFKPKMWGASLVGFDSYHYKYETGREGDMLKVGFSPRKTAMTVYIMPGFERYDDLMSKLGKYKTGKSCLYIKKLSDVDMAVLKELITESYQYMTKKYG